MHIAALKIAFSEAERIQILERIDQALVSGSLSQGRNVRELEEEFASYIGVRHAVAVNSGSSAIEIFMRAVDVRDREVLIPTNTFLATAAGVLLAGGKVRLVDLDANTFAPSLSQLQKRATPETVGVVLVHIGGILSPEITAICEWCDQQGYWLFEDSAHAHGSALNGRFAGSFGKGGAFSFFATKVITSGEGGIFVTDDDHLAEYVAFYRNHGKPHPWISYHTHMGTNCRMSEITAAIALVQLAHLDEILKARAKIADRYTALLARHTPTLLPIHPVDRCSWYKYIVLLPEGYNRSQIKEHLQKRGIDLPSGVYEILLHQQPALAHIANDGFYPYAESVAQRHICLPIYPSLLDEQVEQVVIALAEAIEEHGHMEGS